MAAIICQGMHLSTGSYQRQGCGRLWMSLVNPELQDLRGREQRHLLLNDSAASSWEGGGSAASSQGNKGF